MKRLLRTCLSLIVVTTLAAGLIVGVSRARARLRNPSTGVIADDHGVGVRSL